MNQIQKMIQIQKEYMYSINQFSIQSQIIENRIQISNYLQKGLPVPIMYIKELGLIKSNQTKCQSCQHVSNYQISNDYFCNKHIHEKLYKLNLFIE
jgi:hypothetical protein